MASRLKRGAAPLVGGSGGNGGGQTLLEGGGPGDVICGEAWAAQYNAVAVDLGSGQQIIHGGRYVMLGVIARAEALAVQSEPRTWVI